MLILKVYLGLFIIEWELSASCFVQSHAAVHFGLLLVLELVTLSVGNRLA